MALINLYAGELGFGDYPLLDKADLHIDPKERVCLVGRNGAGKSTLLKVLAGLLPLDDGKLVVQEGIVIARLEQDPPKNSAGKVFDYVAEGAGNLSALLTAHHQLAQNLHNDQDIKELERLHAEIEYCNGWQLEQKIHQILQALGLNGEDDLCNLSGGWLRKTAIARALVCDPDVLLLDEPTNHLDIETIQWLEEFLGNFKGAIVFISHDRSFIQQVATRIVDLDRGKLTSYAGNYSQYLLQKAEDLRVEAEQNVLFDKKLAQEEIWIRQGIKARRTRNEGRVRALKALREEHRQRREVQGVAKITLDNSQRSGKVVFEVENLSYTINGKTIIQDFSCQILRGDKIALIGANGCGKTTLLKLLLGELTPTTGTVRCGTKLEVAYFDQYRASLDPEKTVMDNVADGKQDVEVNGSKRHVLGYLQDFLFPPQRAMTPVKALSGGERNRLLLAKILLKPNNLLILDEPTNDLDIETLELLEELLNTYAGTLLVVSHDRQFIDNTATECFIFGENGGVQKYIGGFSEAKLQQAQAKPIQIDLEANHSTTSELDKSHGAKKSKPRSEKTKLSFKEQQELKNLPSLMEQLEVEIIALQELINNPSFFQSPHVETTAKLTELAEKESQLEKALERWVDLEGRC